MPEREPVFGQKIRSVKARRAKDMRRRMTDAECVLWQCLRRNQLEGLHFRCQQIIDGFVVAFYCHSVGVVIEVGGYLHIGQQDYDAEGDRVLTAYKLHILRFTNEHVPRNLPHVLKTIATSSQAATE